MEESWQADSFLQQQQRGSQNPAGFNAAKRRNTKANDEHETQIAAIAASIQNSANIQAIIRIRPKKSHEV
eukprot:2456419-Prymnesium_polylepis.1